MTGKKVTAVQINAPSTNTGSVAIDADPTNGYELFGPSGKVTLNPGMSITIGYQGAASAHAAVAAGAKRIRIVGTADDVVEFIAVCT